MTSLTRRSRETYQLQDLMSKSWKRHLTRKKRCWNSSSYRTVTAEETTRRQQWLKLSRQAGTAVRKLHRQFGHCPSRVLTEILRASGSRAEYFKAAKLIRCDGCEHEKPKPQTSKSTLLRTYKSNQSIGIDIFEIKDSNGKRYSVLSFLCLGTLYHRQPSSVRQADRLVPNCVYQMFNDKWTQNMGFLEEAITERGWHNRGDFPRGLTARGVQFRTIGVKSPEQLGRTERRGAILKGIIHRVINELKASGDDIVKMILAEALYTKNFQSRVRGFTPMQWVFGKLPRQYDKRSHGSWSIAECPR